MKIRLNYTVILYHIKKGNKMSSKTKSLKKELTVNVFLNAIFTAFPTLKKKEDGSFYHLYPGFSHELKNKVKELFPNLEGGRYYFFMQKLFEMTTQRPEYLKTAIETDTLYRLDGSVYEIGAVDFIKWRADRQAELDEVLVEQRKKAKLHNGRAYFFCLEKWLEQADVKALITNEDAFKKAKALYWLISMLIVKPKRIRLYPEMFQYSLLKQYMAECDLNKPKEAELKATLEMYCNNVSLEEHKEGTKALIQTMRWFCDAEFELPELPPVEKKRRPQANANKRAFSKRDFSKGNDSASRKGKTFNKDGQKSFARDQQGRKPFNKNGVSENNQRKSGQFAPSGQAPGKSFNRNNAFKPQQGNGNYSGNGSYQGRSSQPNGNRLGGNSYSGSGYSAGQTGAAIGNSIHDIGYDANKGTYIRQLEARQQKSAVTVRVKKKRVIPIGNKQ